MIRTFILALLLMLGSAAVAAHSYKQGEIQIGHIWARATAPQAKAGAVFAPFLNKGNAPDKLLGGHTPVAEQIMLHETRKENGIASMAMLQSLDLLPGQPVALRPGGKHIMLIGLKQQLKEGDKFPLTLEFEKAGAVTVDVMVHAAGAMGADH